MIVIERVKIICMAAAAALIFTLGKSPLLLGNKAVMVAVIIVIITIGGMRFHKNTRFNAKAAPVAESLSRTARVIAAIIISVAILTFIIAHSRGQGTQNAFFSAACALVSACPLAFGLTAKAELEAGIQKTGKNGIIINNGYSFEALGKTDIAVLLKSGVVTDDMPRVTDIVAIPKFFDEEIIAFSAAASRNADDPAGRAIFDYAAPKIITDSVKEKTVRTADGDAVSIYSHSHGFIGSVPNAEFFKSVPGYGTHAVVGGRDILVGTRELLKSRGVDTAPLEMLADGFEKNRKVVIFVAINLKAAGIVAVGENLRQSFKPAADRFHSLGVTVYMAAYDSRQSAEAIAKLAGIQHVIFENSRERMFDRVNKLNAGGNFVAVIGTQGDANLFSAASFSIMFKNDAQINGKDNAVVLSDSNSGAGAVLVTGDLEVIPAAIAFSKAIVARIRHNFRLAVLLSVLGAILAVAGLLNPVNSCIWAICSAILFKARIMLGSNSVF